jgi:DNA-binding HxlR family transcriptional regulator
METPRTYGDACGIARGLDLIGERWALLVVRELLLGPRRFTDLRAGLPAASPNVLSQRLRELEHAGVVRRRKLAPPAGSWVYELTAWGAELEPVVIGLGAWALGAPATDSPDSPSADSPDSTASLSAVSAMLSLRTAFAAANRAGRLRATYELGFGEDRYTARVTDGRMAVARGSADQPDAVIETDPATFRAVLSGDRSLAETTGSGTLRLTGDAGAVQRLLDAV